MTRRRGRKPTKMLAAAAWLAEQRPDLAALEVESYRASRLHWRLIADAVRDHGFFSQKTGTIDVPVHKILLSARGNR